MLQICSLRNLFNSGGCVSTNLLFDKNLIKVILERLKNNSDSNEVHLQKYPTKTKNYYLPYCIKFSVTINNREFKSWGNGDSLDEATLKAIAELLERLSCSNFHPTQYIQYNRYLRKEFSFLDLQKNYPRAKNWLNNTSSGFAIHSNIKEAEKGAISELIERHVILKAHALKISPKQFTSPNCLTKFKVPKGFELRFYNWTGPLKHYVTVCKIQTPYKQIMYSFGSDQNLEKSIDKAFYESTGMIIGALKNKRDLSIKTNTDEVTLDSIRDFHLKKETSEFLTILENSVTHLPKIDAHIKRKDFYIGKSVFPNFMGDITPLVSVRAVSPLLQPLFFDYWNKKNINPMAIELKENEFPNDLHIIV